MNINDQHIRYSERETNRVKELLQKGLQRQEIADIINMEFWKGREVRNENGITKKTRRINKNNNLGLVDYRKNSGGMVYTEQELSRIQVLLREKYTVEEIVDIINKEFWKGGGVRTVDSVKSKVSRLNSKGDFSEKKLRNDLRNGKLTPKYQRILNMYNAGVTPRMIHKKTGIPENTIKSQISRIRNVSMRVMNEQQPDSNFILPGYDLVLKENDSLKQQLNRIKAFDEVLMDQVKLNIDKIAIKPPILKPRLTFINKSHKPEVAMLELSDAHIGQEVLAEDMPVPIAYNFNEFVKRVDVLYEGMMEIIEIQRHAIPIKKLVVNMLGDMCTGENIFFGQAGEIDKKLIDQVFEGCRIFGDKLLYPLSKEFEEIDIYSVWGNHGRPHRPGEFHQKTNFDYILYQLLANRFHHFGHVKFHISEMGLLLYQLKEAPKFKHLLTHGDEVKSWMCFVPGNKVSLNDKGFERIEDVRVGDEVIIKDGTSQKVLNKIKKYYKGDILHLEAYGLPDKFWSVTPNHEVLCLKRNKVENYKGALNKSVRDNDLEWMPVGFISKNDYVAIPKIKCKNTIKKLNCKLFWKHMPVKFHHNEKVIASEILVCKELGLILGTYLADGVVYGANKKHKHHFSSAIEICYNKKETSFINEYCLAYKKLFNDEPKIKKIKNVNAYRVISYSQRVGAILEGLGGKYSSKKRLNDVVFCWDKESLRYLLIGYLRGDGYSATRRFFDKFNKDLVHHVSAATMSQQLANQLFWIGIMCDYYPSLKFRMKRDDPCGVIMFYGDSARELAKLTGKNYKGESLDKKKAEKVLETKNYLLYLVKRAYREKYEGYVYDLHIKNNHSYVVGGAVVHNSIPFYGMERTHNRYIQLFGTMIHYLHCLSGDTVIRLVDGTIKTIKELFDNNANNFKVFSSDLQGKLYESNVERVIKKGVQKVYKITLDNDKFFKCTGKHLVLLYNGVYREAQDLLKENVLMPLYVGDVECNFVRKVKSIEVCGEEEVYDLVNVEPNSNFGLECGIFVHNCAHHHNAAEVSIPYGERILNGTFSGGSAWSAKNLQMISQPQQLFFGFNAHYGKTWEYGIKLAEMPDIKPNENGVYTPHCNGVDKRIKPYDKIKE